MSKALSFDPPPMSSESFEDNEITFNIRKFDYFPGLNANSATRRGSATSLLSKGVGSVLNSLQSNNNKTKGGGLRVIHAMVIANNYITIATNDCCIIRLCVENVNEMNYQDIQLIETRRPDDTINNIYVDNTGQHCIVSLKNGDNYYLNYKSTRPKKLTRLNGMIQSVAFDPKSSVDTITKSFLVGTSQGFIYELSLESGGAEKSCTLVYQLDIQIPITSLYFEFFSNSNDGNSADNNDTGDNKIFVMCATSSPTRLYSFVGGPTFTSLFTDHISAGTSAFTELGSDIKKPDLLVYTSRGQKLFALLTKMGIYYGVIRLHGPSVSSDTILTEAQLMPYNLVDKNQANGGNTSPISAASALSLIATDFHFLLLTNDHLQVISKLNGLVEQDSILTKPMSGILVDGTPIGTVRDAVHAQSLWFFTESSIYQFIGNNETRNVWKIYLEKAINGEDKHFDTAMEYCQRIQDREQVVRARAEFYLAVNKFEQAARIYVQANLPFDEVVLRLLRVTSANISDRNAIINKLITSQMLAPPVSLAQMGLKECPELHALRIYLQEKLNLLPSSSKSQRTMIATWICEIFIHHITASTLCASSPTSDTLFTMFKDFLRGNRNILDHTTVFALLNSRGMAKHRALSLFYAQIVGNYDLVLNQYMNEHRYADALVVLSDAPYEKVEQVISKLSPILIEYEPEAATNMFFKHFPRLQPSVVLSALMRYSELLDGAAKDPSKVSILEEDAEGNKCNFAIKYLKNCIDKADNDGYACDSSIYHTLIWFLCKYDSANEDELIEFFQPYVDRLENKSYSMMDLNHVLRQCNRYKRAKSVILTLMLLDMTEDAVQLAIKIDLNFAKELASKSYLNDQRKALWIMIFKHIITANSSNNSRNLPKQLLGLIEESNGVLRIEDLLPHLPDFTEIDTFKDEICGTLEEYAGKIERLKDEMKELSDSAENTAKELEKMKKRGLGVAASQRCEYCTETLFSKIFYLFPCSHGFHSECILRNIHLTCRNEGELHDIKALEESIRKASISAKDPSDKRAITQYEYLLAELDGLIAADCPLCGYAMIRSLEVPLINTAEEIECMKSWAL